MSGIELFSLPKGNLEAIARLATFLNEKAPSGWHFAAGTRFDDKDIKVTFEDPDEGSRAKKGWRPGS